MASSLQGKKDSHLRIVSSEDAVVFPEHAAPTDDAPTVISKNAPKLEPETASRKDHLLADIKRQSPEGLVASLRGRKLAHYELIEPIGVGGMAAVIRARDTQLDRFVALKILPPEMAAEPDNVQRFHQEAKAAAKLDHPNIARAFYCGEDQGLYFIAFEFVEGINLRTMLERRGKLGVPEAIRYVIQVASGLEHASSRGVVHRDVKPSNIIITPSGQAKLVDMGLARNMGRQEQADLTQSGVTLGTFDYISPEQALEPREADSRSDIYSLGCTLYHMLTGQSPVPEGTPLKKLQHHQNVPPPDPQQFNPAIPDDVVRVLGKMMAKNPKDRYQRPIHLVHHLIPLAQKVGAADDLPEGVLFVDAPMPDEPRSRPVLVIALALAALVVVILVLQLAPEPGSQLPKGVSVGETTAVAPTTVKEPRTNDSGGPNPSPPTLPLAHPVKDVKELESALSDRSSPVVRVPIDEIDLKDGLIYRGNDSQRLEMESAEPEAHAILKFRYIKGGATEGLILDGGKEIIFRRIKFEFDSKSSPSKTVAAVLVRGARKVTFDRCIFEQNDVPAISPKRTPLASLLIEEAANSDQPAPVVILRECCFDSKGAAGGQAAVAINGPVTLNATNCAFRPHGALFHFRHDSKLANTAVHLQRCAGFVVHGPAFRFDAEASALVTVKQSVFSRPDNSLAPQEGLPEPNLIFVTDNAPMRYVGTSNLYHNLNALVARKNMMDFFTSPDEFQKYLALNNGSDQQSKYLDAAASPLRHTQPLLAQLEDQAFQLKAEYHGQYGLEKTWMMREMAPPPPVVVKTLPVNPKLKTVDATNDGTRPGVFSKLDQALSIAQDGDVIEIKCGDNQEVVVPPIFLQPGISVTLRPAQGFHPILVLNKAFSVKDTYLFKVQAGRLTFEQLEIRLDPGQSDFEVLSIVQLGETAQCVFKNCVLSLKDTNKLVQLNVVTFLDTDKMMKTEPGAVMPARVEFDECFVRGRGDLVSLRGCRLLQVDVKNSLIALAGGSLLDIQAADKSMPMDQGVQWKMERSSVFTAEPLFILRSSRQGKGLTKTNAKIEGCLLVALAPDQPVVALETMRDEKYLEWDSRQNFYTRFDRLRDWKELYPEDRSFYEKLAFPLLDDEDAVQNLWQSTPQLFHPVTADRERLNGFGIPADVEQHLLPPLTKADES